MSPDAAETQIRDEVAADREAIASVLRAAFGGEDEARLVDRLRMDGDLVVSLTAEEGGSVIGHIGFSRLEISRGERSIRAVALAPVAVRPHRQRRGTGSALVRVGLERCDEAGYAAVLVLGHPDYYPRFGFSAGLAERLCSPFSGPAFMALALEPEALDGTGWAVSYPPAFGPG